MEAKRRIKVGIIEQRMLVRESLVLTIKAERDMETSSAPSFEEFCELNATPDVALISGDSQMHAVAAKLRRTYPRSKVVALHIDNNADFVEAVQMGVCGFIEKESGRAEILD